MACIKCGGEMIGDGYTSVEHCENADETAYEFHEPDAGPVYCNYVDLFPDRDKRPQCFAWAPGMYGHTCTECDKEFLGDKLASMCAPCAYGDHVKPGERRFKT